MDLFVTASAKAHQITLVIASAFRKRNDVMNLLDRYVPSFKKAALTKRVLSYVSITDLFPLVSVASICLVTAGEAFVVLLFDLSMLLAVLLTIFTQVLAAWIAAGTFRLPWHYTSLPSINNKSPKRLILSRLRSIS
jgi:hypothetical protein